MMSVHPNTDTCLSPLLTALNHMSILEETSLILWASHRKGRTVLCWDNGILGKKEAGLAAWHGGLSVPEMIGCARDRRLWADMLTNIT